MPASFTCYFSASESVSRSFELKSWGLEAGIAINQAKSEGSMEPKPYPVLGTRWYRFIRWIAREVCFRALGGIRVSGSERVPSTGPLLVAPVHLSYLDPPVVACALRRALCFVAKEELFRVPVLGALIRSLDAFPIRRGETDAEAVRRAIELLKSGRAVLVFPEGTRGMGEVMGRVTAGSAMLAKRSGATVLPVGIAGTEYVLPRNRKCPRRRHIHVVFGEPFSYGQIATEENERANRQKFAEEIESRIVALCHEAGLPIRSAERIQDSSANDPEREPTESTGPSRVESQTPPEA